MPFFAVRTGRECGIFEDIDKLKSSVINFRGAEFAEFQTLEAADTYLTSYATVYVETMNPPADPATVILQTFGQQIARDKWVFGAGCFNSPFIAVGEETTPEKFEAICVYEFLKRVPDDDKEYTCIVRSYEALNGASKDKVLYPNKTDAGQMHFNFDDGELKSDDEVLDILKQINETNASRKKKVILKEVTDEGNSYMSRIAMNIAARILMSKLQQLASPAGASESGGGATSSCDRDGGSDNVV